MRTFFVSILIASSAISLWGNDDASPEVAAIGMLPKQRTAQRLAPSERNPFAVKPKEMAKSAPEETETQESKIRALFKNIKVSGIRRGTDGRLTALVGDLILREGEEVKPVLPDQTELLMVSKIEPRKVELTFVENKDSTQPRTIVMPINNQPRVAQKLFAQGKEGREMYYPALRAAAAGVATVLNAAGGSGVASPTQTSLGSGGELAGGDAASGIGVITAPPPPVPSVAAVERQSFAALAPGGTPRPPSVPPAPIPAAPATQSHKPNAAGVPPPAAPAVSDSVEPNPTPVAPPPHDLANKPAQPVGAGPIPSAESAAPKPPAGSTAANSPLRLAVPPPPAKSRPVIE